MKENSNLGTILFFSVYHRVQIQRGDLWQTERKKVVVGERLILQGFFSSHLNKSVYLANINHRCALFFSLLVIKEVQDARFRCNVNI